MAIASVDEYLSALEKSKLLGSEQFAQAQGLAGGLRDARALARALAREKLVSRWQAGTLLELGKRAQLRLGKYKLIERIGKGGMGTVFLAEHVTMNRRVALKIVPRAIAKDRASLDRFFAEARAIASLDHPNIVQAYSVDNDLDRYFIVMEFIDGEDLQRIVETGGTLDFARAAEYTRQAAEGLAHAHARNLVHCDVKPSNLLLNKQGQIKILDLGLARLNQSDDSSSSGDITIGTVDYMAPEQGLGTADFDYRADIYSLGCTLYFLLTGHPPFPEGTLAQRIAKHQSQEPPDILAERPDTPPKLIEICKRMMAKEPCDRFQSMREVSEAIEFVTGGEQTAVPAPRAVKPIEEAPANGLAGDWLEALAREASLPSFAGAANSSIAKSSSMRVSVRSGKQTGKTASGGRVEDAASSGLRGFVETKFAWFNTTQRRIIGAVGGLIALAAVAALPMLFSQTPPESQAAPEEKAPNKAGTLEDPVGRPAEARPDKMSTGSQAAEKLSLPAKTSPGDANSHATAVGSTNKPSPSPPPSESKPDTQIAALPPPKVQVKPAPTPSAKPVPPAKPIEVAKQVALDGLLAAVDLPSIKATSVISLGKIESAPKVDLDVRLLGGEAVAKGNPAFELAKEGDSPAWSVLMVDRNGGGVKVARFFLDGGECKFEWTADAREKESLLRFCGLQFGSGDKKHVTVLTAPKPVAPLLVDADFGIVRQRMNRDFALPDASLLHLQILPLDKPMPHYEIKVAEKGRGRAVRGKTQEPVAGDTISTKERALVTLVKDGTPRVTFQIGFDPRGKEVTLDMQGACEVGDELVPFNTNSIDVRASRAAFIIASEASQAKKPSQSALQDDDRGGQGGEPSIQSPGYPHRRVEPQRLGAVLHLCSHRRGQKRGYAQSCHISKFAGRDREGRGTAKAEQGQGVKGPQDAECGRRSLVILWQTEEITQTDSIKGGTSLSLGEGRVCASHHALRKLRDVPPAAHCS